MERFRKKYYSRRAGVDSGLLFSGTRPLPGWYQDYGLGAQNRSRNKAPIGNLWRGVAWKFCPLGKNKGRRKI